MLFSDVILEQQVGQQQWDNAQVAISQRQPFSFRGSLMANPQARVSLKFRPADNDHLGGDIPLIGIPNFVMLDEGGGREAVLYFATAEVSTLARTVSLVRIDIYRMLRGVLP